MASIDNQIKEITSRMDQLSNKVKKVLREAESRIPNENIADEQYGVVTSFGRDISKN